MTRQLENEFGLTPEDIAILNKDLEGFENKNPKIYQVMQEAKKAGVLPANILYVLRGGNYRYEKLANLADYYITAAVIVRETETNRRDELPGVYIDKFFRQHVQSIQTQPGANPAFLKQAFDVLRAIYPERTAMIPA